MRRRHPNVVPAENPWSGAERDLTKKTKPAATRVEAYALAYALRERGEPHLGAAALICFELHQRPEHVLAGDMTWNDYESGYLRNFVDEIGRLEEAYSHLPGWARTPQMQRLWIVACLRKIEHLCEVRAHIGGFHYEGIAENPDERARNLVRRRPRFYRVLMKALLEVNDGGCPALFMTPSQVERISRPNQVAPASQRDRGLKWIHARAAAILHLAKGYGFYRANKGEWADRIAAALSEAGMPGAKTTSGKATRELTGSAVAKWLAACQGGRCGKRRSETRSSSQTSLYQRFLKNIENEIFLAADPDERVRMLVDEIDKLSDIVALRYGHRIGRPADAENRKDIAYFYRMATGCDLTDEALGNISEWNFRRGFATLRSLNRREGLIACPKHFSAP